MLLSDASRLQLGHLQQGYQPRSTGLAQCGQASLQEIAGLAGLQGYISDDAQSDQIQVLLDPLRLPRPAEQFLGQLIGRADPRQGGGRVIGREQARVDDSMGSRQLSGQLMMVADDKVQADLIGIVYGCVGGDAGVTGQDQPQFFAVVKLFKYF